MNLIYDRIFSDVVGDITIYVDGQPFLLHKVVKIFFFRYILLRKVDFLLVSKVLSVVFVYFLHYNVIYEDLAS